MTGRRRSRGAGALTAAVVFFLLGPLLIVVLFSFHSARTLTFPFEGLSTKWYSEALSDPDIADAFGNSMKIAIAVALLALLVGTAAAYALTRSRARPRVAIGALVAAPIAVPGLFLGVSLSLFYGQVGITPSLLAVSIGHFVLALPFFVVLAVGALDRTNRALEDVSADLGSSPFRTFRKVLLPQVWPVLAGGTALAFMLSLDEIFVTNFVIGSDQTLPTLVLQRMRRTIDPTINVISTLLVVGTFTLVLISAGVLRLTQGRGVVPLLAEEDR